MLILCQIISDNSQCFSQSEILDELKHKVKEKKVLNQDEVGFGTVDGILEGNSNKYYTISLTINM